MFESHLAPAATAPRDLSSFEIWQTSLERSRRRRALAATHRRAAPKTRARAAAVGAALLVSPTLALDPATAAMLDGGPRSASVMPPAIDGLIASRGDVGGPVQALQRAVGVTADGIFGPITQRAVKEFQARAGLKPTGDVDPQTWEALLHAAAGDNQQPKTASPTKAAPGRRTLRSLRKLRSVDNGGTPAVAAVSDGAPMLPPAQACGEPLTTPVNGQFSSAFGDGRNHAGVDLTAPVGTPVVAAACGTVTRAASESGYGNIVCIRHNPSLSTCYAHLSEIAVQRRAHVAAGQLVGTVGTTGRSSGPHLHFEVRVGGRAQDPAPLLSRAQPVQAEPIVRAARASTPKRGH